MIYYYIVKSCLGFNHHPVGLVIESTTELSIGDIVSYEYEGTVYCGQIINTADFPSNATTLSRFTFCCECLTSVGGTNYTSFDFKVCNTEEIINVDTSVFCNSTNIIPQIGDIYQLLNPATDLILCAEFTGGGFSRTEIWYFNDGPFENCNICNADLPRSANTESFVCEICCPCTTGTTINSVIPPHPVWTDNKGISVTQLNMIVLGGENGLNN